MMQLTGNCFAINIYKATKNEDLERFLRNFQ